VGAILFSSRRKRASIAILLYTYGKQKNDTPLFSKCAFTVMRVRKSRSRASSLSCSPFLTRRRLQAKVVHDSQEQVAHSLNGDHTAWQLQLLGPLWRVKKNAENHAKRLRPHLRVRKCALVDHYQQALPQPIYQPAVVPIPGTRKHSLRKMAIAVTETPDRMCGAAQRVGYTGTLETDLAMYRLRVKPDSEHGAVTLGGFFVLEKGRFRAYEPGPDNARARSPQGYSTKERFQAPL
jgi:hypothetical protein